MARQHNIISVTLTHSSYYINVKCKDNHHLKPMYHFGRHLFVEVVATIEGLK
jgi:hypothetical protein